jgi:hypothetical protein
VKTSVQPLDSNTVATHAFSVAMMILHLCRKHSSFPLAYQFQSRSRPPVCVA